MDGYPGGRGRSIPAGAGEPNSTPPQDATLKVYPRGCGGTAAGLFFHSVSKGLSPRVRGNLPALPLPPIFKRSIPAGAGEPPVERTHKDLLAVYPRGCGGTIGWHVLIDA